MASAAAGCGRVMRRGTGGMGRVSVRVLVLAVAVVLLGGGGGVDALKHKLHLKRDARDLISLETFGFLAGGVLNITVTEFQLDAKSSSSSSSSHNAGGEAEFAGEPTEDGEWDRRALAEGDEGTGEGGDGEGGDGSDGGDELPEEIRVGILARWAETESALQRDLEELIEKKKCLFDIVQEEDVHLDLSNPTKWDSGVHVSHTFTRKEEGLYTLLFARCEPPNPGPRVGFRMNVEFYNPGPNYLSAGDVPLPTMYLCFFVAYLAATLLWSGTVGIHSFRQTQEDFSRPRGSRDGAKRVHNIHHVMTLLLIFKTVTMMSEAMRYHYIKRTGASELWSIVYYIFAILKGVTLFTVIILIGSGWTLIKPYLTPRDKKIILSVLVLQVLDNVAMVIMDETEPGTRSFALWRDLLYLVDIICCAVILFNIVWSIYHLKQAAEADGKMANNLIRLQQFREFYIMVVAYVYFTRIVVLLMESTLPYKHMWMGPFATEMATIIFYMITGWKFRPTSDNEYLPVRQDDDDEMEEFGLDDSETEMVEQNVRGSGGVAAALPPSQQRSTSDERALV